VPHFDAKGEADHFFSDAGVPTTFLLTTFYWDNMINFGMNPKRGEDGKLSFLLPMGDRRLAGVAAEDIGKCAYGIFKAGDEYKNKKIGIAGDHLTGEEMVSILSKAIGEEVQYQSVSPAVFRSFGFPGADDLGNMFQFYQEFEDHFRTTRDLNLSRKLNPDMQNFETWAERNKERIPLS
jgi:uncharacterized protein YbjT (DUF2867 family)